MVPGERFIDRETMGDMFFYTEDLELLSSSEQQAAHALFIGDTDRWPDPIEWEIEDTFGEPIDRVHELRDPPCPACEGEGYCGMKTTWTPTSRAGAAPPTASSTAAWAATPTQRTRTRRTRKPVADGLITRCAGASGSW